MTLIQLKKELKSKADPKKAKLLQGFFKTGPGQYGEGDIFLGVIVPEIRKTAKKFSHLKLNDLKKLLQSKIHEERLAALLILVNKFEEAEDKIRQQIYDFYLKHKRHINNWDLVDLSAHKIVGAHLLDKPKDILHKMAESKNVWERRIAVIATFNFIKNEIFEDALKIAKKLLKENHDLIHKAAGWMLREIGKRDLAALEEFLKKHYKDMPRTMLRYAIERLPEKKRQAYLKGSA